ncbi:hypothetical protein D3C72_1253980 [compost metagenome]
MPRVRTRSTFWKLVTVGNTVVLVWLTSASRMSSSYTDTRKYDRSTVRSKVRSFENERSGFRLGSLLISEVPVMRPWNSSATVG